MHDVVLDADVKRKQVLRLHESFPMNLMGRDISQMWNRVVNSGINVEDVEINNIFISDFSVAIE